MDELKDIDKVKYEKMILHIKYIAGISLIVTFGAVALAGYNDSAFVSQFSFASTVTSIVLSVVAIWMTITGERQMNDVKDKIINANDKLAESTLNIKNINKNSQVIIEQQKLSYEKMQEELKIILNQIDEKVSKSNNLSMETLSLLNNKNVHDTEEQLSKDSIREIVRKLGGSFSQSFLMLINIAIESCYLNYDGDIIIDFIKERLRSEYGKNSEIRIEEEETISAITFGIYCVLDALNINKVIPDKNDLCLDTLINEEKSNETES